MAERSFFMEEDDEDAQFFLPDCIIDDLLSTNSSRKAEVVRRPSTRSSHLSPTQSFSNSAFRSPSRGSSHYSELSDPFQPSYRQVNPPAQGFHDYFPQNQTYDNFFTRNSSETHSRDNQMSLEPPPGLGFNNVNDIIREEFNDHNSYNRYAEYASSAFKPQQNRSEIFHSQEYEKPRTRQYSQFQQSFPNIGAPSFVPSRKSPLQTYNIAQDQANKLGKVAEKEKANSEIERAFTSKATPKRTIKKKKQETTRKEQKHRDSNVNIPDKPLVSRSQVPRKEEIPVKPQSKPQTLKKLSTAREIPPILQTKTKKIGSIQKLKEVLQIKSPASVSLLAVKNPDVTLQNQDQTEPKSIVDKVESKGTDEPSNIAPINTNSSNLIDDKVEEIVVDTKIEDQNERSLIDHRVENENTLVSERGDEYEDVETDYDEDDVGSDSDPASESSDSEDAVVPAQPALRTYSKFCSLLKYTSIRYKQVLQLLDFRKVVGKIATIPSMMVALMSWVFTLTLQGLWMIASMQVKVFVKLAFSNQIFFSYVFIYLFPIFIDFLGFFSIASSARDLDSLPLYFHYFLVYQFILCDPPKEAEFDLLHRPSRRDTRVGEGLNLGFEKLEVDLSVDGKATINMVSKFNPNVPHKRQKNVQSLKKKQKGVRSMFQAKSEATFNKASSSSEEVTPKPLLQLERIRSLDDHLRLCNEPEGYEILYPEMYRGRLLSLVLVCILFYEFMNEYWFVLRLGDCSRLLLSYTLVLLRTRNNLNLVFFVSLCLQLMVLLLYQQHENNLLMQLAFFDVQMLLS